MPGRKHFMTLKDLENKIYDIINTGDELMTVQDKADAIMAEVLKWQDRRDK